MDKHKLLDIQTKKIKCNKELEEIFNSDSIDINDLTKYLNLHLMPSDPIEFTHVIRVSGSPNENLSAFSFQFHHMEENEGNMFKQVDNEIKQIDNQVKQNRKQKKRNFLFQIIFFFSNRYNNSSITSKRERKREIFSKLFTLILPVSSMNILILSY